MNRNKLLLPLIIVALILAVWSGWMRMGWQLALTKISSHHGALMVGSFLSTLIFLERAASFRQKWVLLIPLVNGLSTIFFLLKMPLMAWWLLAAGSAGFTGICIYFILKFKHLFYYIFFVGAISLLIGNIILLRGGIYPEAVNWWMIFFLFTIVAERLELTRFLKISHIQILLLLISLAVVFFSIFIPPGFKGHYFFAFGIIACSNWLLQNDMARFAIKRQGQHRYSALLLIVGYAWLIVTGVFIFIGHRFVFGYDIILHSFFIGFVFSMIFSHAPVIFPAVMKVTLKLYRPVMYVWFGILQLSLLARITGDIVENMDIRKWGAMLNGVAIVLFFVSIPFILLSAKNQSGVVQS